MSDQSSGGVPASDGTSVSGTPAPPLRLRGYDPRRMLCKILRQLLRHLLRELRKAQALSVRWKAEDILWVVEWWKEHLDGLPMHLGGAADVEDEWAECVRLLRQAEETTAVLSTHLQGPCDPATAEAEYNKLVSQVRSAYTLALTGLALVEAAKVEEAKRTAEAVVATTT